MVIGIVLFISLLLAVFLVTVKTNHKISNRLFAVFLVITAVDMSAPLFNLMLDGPSNLGMARNSFAFLQIPVFYLYVLSVSYSDFTLKPKHIIHLFPFLIANAVLVPRFYAVDITSKIEFLTKHQDMFELQLNHTLIHLQIVIYLVAVFIILRKARKLYLENHAGTSINSYNWLLQFTVLLTVLYMIALFKNIYKFSDYPYISEWIKAGLIVFQLLIICWYLFKALNNPELFRNIDSKLKLASDIVLEEEIDASGTYEDELIILKKYMVKEEPFLNPSISIQGISDEIDIPVRNLSLLINNNIGLHFFDFINSYRIESAKEILKDATKSKVTILEILYAVGFNSKSSFNTAFKKHTGLTPTSYRKSLNSNGL